MRAESNMLDPISNDNFRGQNHRHHYKADDVEYGKVAFLLIWWVGGEWGRVWEYVLIWWLGGESVGVRE